MYKDIITYELSDGTTEAKLIGIAKQIVNDWMKNQHGFIKWEINSNSDNSYTDIVYWESKEAAKRAEEQMGNIPNASDWYGCYKQGTINSKGLTSMIEL
jgi:hypothetical protein